MESLRTKDTKEDKEGPKPRRFLNGWSKEHERLMSDWSDISLCYRWIHDHAEKFYHSKSLWINLPVIILSTLGGTANFGVQSLFESETTKKYASFGIGGISLLAGLLTTVGNYLRYAQLEEGHRGASMSWGKFQRLIAIEVALNPIERMDALDFLKVCRVELDRLIEQSPPIPATSIEAFARKFGQIRELKKPDICGQLEHTHVYDSSEMRLKQLAVDAALMLKHKKNALRELWSPQMEDTIRKEVDRQVENALRAHEERLASLSSPVASPVTSPVASPVVSPASPPPLQPSFLPLSSREPLENVVVIPSSMDWSTKPREEAPSPYFSSHPRSTSVRSSTTTPAPSDASTQTRTGVSTSVPSPDIHVSARPFPFKPTH